MKIKKQKIFTFFLLGARALSINRVICGQFFFGVLSLPGICHSFLKHNCIFIKENGSNIFLMIGI